MARKQKEITEQEKLFAEAYCSNGFKRREAVKAAGYKTDNIQAKGAALLKRPVVIDYISSILEKKKTTFFINEMDILEGLYAEAKLDKDDGGTQQGRIQAWTQIGKHLGMFDSKVKDLQKANSGSGTTINILNYNVPEGTEKPKEKDITPDVKEIEREASTALAGINIESYAIKEESEDE